MRQRHQSYFYHSKKERNAIIVLLIICLLLASFPHLYFLFQKEPSFAELSFPEVKAWIKLPSEKKQFQNVAEIPNDKVQAIRSERFVFDPNTASESDLLKLGLSEKIVSTIKNYRSKGGKFKTASDFNKIWGMPPKLSKELEPYIHIQYGSYENKKLEYEKKWQPKQIRLVHINTADSLQFLSLPGIGPTLTSRILKFRERLGGFISINQVSEIYGLADSVFQKIRPYLICDPKRTRKINLNTATLDELGHHPYIRYAVARLIIAYREQHGNFTGTTDLQKIMVLSDSLFNRIKPYITADE